LIHNEASGVPSLSKSTIEKIKIHVPALNEQEKIVHLLWSVDGKIKILVNQIEKVKQFKKGLLQQMFV
jgi:type I restriction enzyme S subunit